jgi:hypothetical protein
MTAPGWYPDPSGVSRQRYFDGKQWTDSYAPYATAATPPPPPGQSTPAPKASSLDWWRQRSTTQRWLLGGGAGIAVLLLVIPNAMGANNKPNTPATSSSTSSVSLSPTLTDSPSPTATAGAWPTEAAPAPSAAPLTPIAPQTAYANHDGSCDGDITPKKDGICKVSDGGFLSVGLMAGWIESAGPRDPASYPNCMWERLSGPDAGDVNMIIESDMMEGSTGVTRAHIQPSDYAFWSKGCQPWERLTDK